MPFVQSIDNAQATRIGAEGVPADALADVLKRSEAALDWLRARHADGGLPLLRLPAQRDDLDGITQAARKLVAGATDVVLLGTGGSSLGGQTLAQLAGHAVPGVGLLRDPPRIHFMDNLDPESFATLLARLPLCHHALCRHFQIRRHRRDADAERGGAGRAETGRLGEAHR